MSTLTLQLDEPLATGIERAARASRLAPDEWAKVQLASAVGASPEADGGRVLGLHAGEAYAISDDFSVPLADFAEHA